MGIWQRVKDFFSDDNWWEEYTITCCGHSCKVRLTTSLDVCNLEARKWSDGISDKGEPIAVTDLLPGCWHHQMDDGKPGLVAWTGRDGKWIIHEVQHFMNWVTKRYGGAR